MSARFALLLLAWLAACAQPSVTWRNADGDALPETGSVQSEDGFGGHIIVTSDAEWREKWATPADVAPTFHTVESVSQGEQVFVLIFFANPSLDAAGAANVTCDIDLTRPDGTRSIEAEGVTAHQGVLAGSPFNTYLAAPVIEFVGEPDDLPGRWVVNVSLHDTQRPVTLELTTSFVLR